MSPTGRLTNRRGRRRRFSGNFRVPVRGNPDGQRGNSTKRLAIIDAPDRRPPACGNRVTPPCRSSPRRKAYRAPTSRRGCSSSIRTWSGSRAARSAWARTGTIPEEAPVPSRHGRRLLDRPDAGHQPAVQEFVNATGYVTFAETKPRPEGLSRRAAAHALGRLARLLAPRPSGRLTQTGVSWWHFMFGANWRRPYGPGSSITRPRRSSGRARRLPGCPGLRGVGRQGLADRSRVGVRGARRARRRRIRLGRRVRARRPPHGQHLAGQFPTREPAR